MGDPVLLQPNGADKLSAARKQRVKASKGPLEMDLFTDLIKMNSLLAGCLSIDWMAENEFEIHRGRTECRTSVFLF